MYTITLTSYLCNLYEDENNQEYFPFASKEIALMFMKVYSLRPKVILSIITFLTTYQYYGPPLPIRGKVGIIHFLLLRVGESPVRKVGVRWKKSLPEVDISFSTWNKPPPSPTQTGSPIQGPRGVRHNIDCCIVIIIE